jgi:hypothetical protein
MVYMQHDHDQAKDFDVVDNATGLTVPGAIEWINEEAGFIHQRLNGEWKSVAGDFSLVAKDGSGRKPTY